MGERSLRALHKDITITKVQDAVLRQMNSLDNPGFCVACGHEQDGCEPDARNYKCEACGAMEVYGAQELLMMIA